MKRLLLVLLLCFPLTVAAETYQWVDESGTVNFSEDLGKVPKKYRKKAKRLGGEEEAAPAPASETAAEPQSAKAKEEAAGGEAKLIGGKDEAGWRREFLHANANLQNAEAELAALRGRLENTSGMSRSEYLAIQNSIKHAELRVQDHQKRLSQLRERADRLGVPSAYRH